MSDLAKPQSRKGAQSELTSSAPLRLGERIPIAPCDPCPLPTSGDGWFWCERHRCQKHPHWVVLCQTDARYFRAWEDGRGPGQAAPAAERPPPAPRTCPVIGTPCEHAAILRFSLFCRLDLPAIPGRCGQDKEARASGMLALRLVGRVPPCPKTSH